MIIFRSPDEVAEYAITTKQQQQAVENIIVREANRIEDLIQKRQGLRTYDNTDDFLESLEDDIHHIEPCS